MIPLIGITTKGIAFIRSLPDGTEVGQTIERSGPVQSEADQFIARGGRYRIALLPDGDVRVAATVKREGEILEIYAEQVRNGPELPDCIDSVVMASIGALDEVQ